MIKESVGANFVRPRNKGITLIALVVTIIVMLILVAVTVSYSIKSGLLSKAKEAKKAQEIAQEKEKVELAVQTAKIDLENLELATEKLEQTLQKEFGKDYILLTSDENSWSYTGKFAMYYISKEGKVTIGEQISRCIIYGNTSNLLPDEYQQVEYIESTGTQYINTGIEPTINTKVETTILVPKTQKAKYPRIFGAQKNANGTNAFLMGINTGTTWWARTGESGNVGDTSFTAELNNIYNVKLQYNSFVVDNWSTIGIQEFTSGTGGSIFIFTASVSGKLDSGLISIVRMYSFKIYENDILVRDFIPCYRKSDNIIGMYDTVGGDFYTNQGEGDFLKGKIIGVGEINDDNKYEIPLKTTTASGKQTVTVTLDSPLRKLGDTADYLDLANKKVVRYIGEDGKVLKDKDDKISPLEEEITIENLPEIKDIISIEVETTIKPSKIVE